MEEKQVRRLRLRLIIMPPPPGKAAGAVRKVKRRGGGKQRKTDPRTELAAGFMMLVTSPPPGIPAGDIRAVCRPRWRIELAFKRLRAYLPEVDGGQAMKTRILRHFRAISLIGKCSNR